ncbi:MAG: BON domain-containing protein, partial [Rhodobacteraceae bacterium]|uniref:BON domain-containing protein n=1 Tax=Accumulibacter sp. TaxID=2053492 RepID=UPI0019EE5DF8|nr:BON domain-containing protein [Accumulibacter sp.]MBE2259551.1 BON domain-containing protein [Paracoccaceae bacterium]
MNKVLATSLLAGAALLPMLQACVPLVAAGATQATLSAVDRRSLGTQTEDETIEWKAAVQISEIGGKESHTNFTSYNRKVLISGEVPSENIKTEVERRVAALPQVRGVYNELAVAPPTSFGTRSNDSYITTKVKARFVDAGKFNAVYVKVVTEDGVVYLLGLVTQREADAAIQIARTTSDVKKVVTLFEIIPEARAKELDVQVEPSKPANPDSIDGG